MEREYRVLAALHRIGFPVPAPLCLCEDAGIIGTPFYVMSHVEGRVFTDVALRELAPSARADIYAAAVACLASLHAVDPARVGLESFGQPTGTFTFIEVK